MDEPRRGTARDGERANWRQTLSLAVGAVIVAGLLALTPQGRGLEWRSFDLLSTAAPRHPPTPSSVIVAIDEPSFAEFGQWPWPRGLHARLVEQLRAAGAKAIVLDLVFAEPGASPAADEALATAMRPDVVLAADHSKIDTPSATIETDVLPLPALLENGAQFGFAKVPQSSLDGFVRKIPTQADALAAVALQATGKTSTARPTANSLIQYFGPPQKYFERYSYYQAIDWRVSLPKNPFKDRVVIVGFSQDAQADVRSADAFGTPYTTRGKGWSFGAEIHATILDNLRYGLWIGPLPAWVSILLGLAIAIATGHLLRQFHPWRAGLWTLAGLALIPLFSFALLQFGRLWLQPVLPVTALVLMSVGRTGLGYLEERARRQRVVTMFGHYLAPEMVERLQDNPDLLKLGGEVKELTILFCDVRGFTTISEGMQADPERLTHLVNRILTPLSNCVLAEKGAIDKYIGDCIMAFWNAPLDEPEHALKAARAALAMMDAIALLNRQLAAEGLPGIAVGIGLNTGRCVVGNMGSEQRFDYSALGDSVNLASRLESASKELGVSVVIGPETARQIGDRLPLVLLETIHVKGKRAAIAVHTIAPELTDKPDALHELRDLLGRIGAHAEDTEALIKRALEIAPSLAGYFAQVRDR
ncbi:MAG: adenylate/guanylate cyclase domain-containing protein [Dongiaceae bacterium]